MFIKCSRERLEALADFERILAYSGTLSSLHTLDAQHSEDHFSNPTFWTNYGSCVSTVKEGVFGRKHASLCYSRFEDVRITVAAVLCQTWHLSGHSELNVQQYRISLSSYAESCYGCEVSEAKGHLHIGQRYVRQSGYPQLMPCRSVHLGKQFGRARIRLKLLQSPLLSTCCNHREAIGYLQQTV